jgi:uncharacterized protein (PEP-CTERM system associated)
MADDQPPSTVTGSVRRRRRLKAVAGMGPTPQRLRPSAAMLMAGGLIASAAAHGSDWKFSTFGSAGVTLTDNANLAPSGQEKGDAILQGTAGISASREGARLKVNATYAPTGIIYVDGTSSNRWVNTLSASGSLEAVEDFFFIDARASISQQFVSPFGPTPTDLATATSNRTNVTTLGVTPYIRGRFAATGMTYLVRNDSNWTDASGTGTGWAYSNSTVARLDSAPAKVSWGLEYNRRNTNYAGQSGFVNDAFRGRLYWTPDPQFRIYAIGGYETNNYSVTNQSGAIYGGGLDWRPSERTTVAGYYEERFYGPSYQANVTHRTPLSFWALRASRIDSTYPQQVQTLAPGNTATILDSLLVARFPDPVERQAEVQRLIQTLGLPAVLVAPQAFYTQTVFVNEQISLTAGLSGARNTVTFTVFTGYSEQIPATLNTEVQGAFAAATKIDQRGASGNWSHRLTPLTSLNFLASRTETLARQPTGSESTTDRFVLNLSRPLGPKTNGSVGLRYTIFDSNVSNDYTEAAVFAGVNHRF